MLLQLDHLTRYDYAAPVAQADHVALLRPLDDAHQQVLAHSVHIDPTPGFQHERVDASGHLRLHFSHHRAHRHMAVHSRSRVQVAPRFAELAPAAAPAWEGVVEGLRYRGGHPQPAAVAWAQPSPRIPRLPELAAYARSAVKPGQPLALLLLALMQKVHDDFTFDPASTEVDTPLASAFAQRRGVCQDFTHVLIGMLRGLGLPARYVSGYLLTHPPEGMPRLVGADASHAWVQAWCPATPGVPGDWLDLDPTNACVPGPEHVRLGVGRDYEEVAPLRGVLRGGGTHTLSVEVDVGPVVAKENEQEVT